MVRQYLCTTKPAKKAFLGSKTPLKISGSAPVATVMNLTETFFQCGPIVEIST